MENFEIFQLEGVRKDLEDLGFRRGSKEMSVCSVLCAIKSGHNSVIGSLNKPYQDGGMAKKARL